MYIYSQIGSYCTNDFVEHCLNANGIFNKGSITIIQYRVNCLNGRIDFLDVR